MRAAFACLALLVGGFIMFATLAYKGDRTITSFPHARSSHSRELARRGEGPPPILPEIKPPRSRVLIPRRNKVQNFRLKSRFVPVSMPLGPPSRSGGSPSTMLRW